MPMIRRLCSALEAPAAPPHVFAGVSSILTLPAPLQSVPLRRSEPKKDKIPAMMVAVYLFVSTRLSGVEITPGEYSQVRGTALEILNRIDAGEADKEVVDGEDVDEWLREIRDRGWTSLDWFENVGEGTGLGLEGIGVANGSPEADSGSEQEKVPMRQSLISLDRSKKNTLQAGLGTMVSIVDLVFIFFQAYLSIDAREGRLSK